MEYGVHLPLIGFAGRAFSLDGLLRYVEAAGRLGFRAVSANDHLVFPRPWLDGPTALAVVLPRTGRMSLATTVALPVVRGPAVLAKTLAALDLLSGGRLIAGVGPGSSARDYAAVGIPFAERWARLDEAVQALRSLWGGRAAPFTGRFYATAGVPLEPGPARPGGPPIWIGSWGSDAGLRRVARLADGWLASAYHTTPAGFGAAWGRLRGLLRQAGRDPEAFPNAVATMFCYVTDDRAVADRVLRDLLGGTLNRPVDELRERLLVGPAEACAARLAAYRAAGAQRVYLWPVADELRQLELLAERVLPAASTFTP